MNRTKTSTMLQRIPVILAVTAASYGLQVPPKALRLSGSNAPAVRVADAPSTTTQRLLPAPGAKPVQRG